MTTLQLLIVCVFALLIVLVLAGRTSQLEPLQDPADDLADESRWAPGDRITVHLAEGQALEGIVVRDDPVELEDVMLRTPGVAPSPMKGLVMVPEERIVLVQQPEGVAVRMLRTSVPAPAPLVPAASENGHA